MKFIAFDIETHKITPEDEDVMEHRPLGISCVATVSNGSAPPMKWYHNAHNTPTPEKMSASEVRQFIYYLLTMSLDGYKIVTWNGTFDFTILAEESITHYTCMDMAEEHYDPMFQMLCMRGFPVGLDATAQGFGLPGKPEGMSGVVAPVLWQGTVEDRYKVLEYVAGDALSTLQVVEKIQETGYLRWITKKGKRSSQLMKPLKTVKECKLISLPDTSWMDSNIPREKFYNWKELFGENPNEPHEYYPSKPYPDLCATCGRRFEADIHT